MTMAQRKNRNRLILTLCALIICFIMIIPVYLLAKTSFSTCQVILLFL